MKKYNKMFVVVIVCSAYLLMTELWNLWMWYVAWNTTSCCNVCYCLWSGVNLIGLCWAHWNWSRTSPLPISVWTFDICYRVDNLGIAVTMHSTWY